jgi:hypothetical protein
MIEEWCAIAVIDLNENRRDSIAKLLVQRLCSIINFESKRKETQKQTISKTNNDTNHGTEVRNDNQGNVENNTGRNDNVQNEGVVQTLATSKPKGKLIVSPTTITRSKTPDGVIWLLMYSVKDECFMCPSNELPGSGPKGLLYALVTWVTNVQAKGKLQ